MVFRPHSFFFVTFASALHLFTLVFFLLCVEESEYDDDSVDKHEDTKSLSRRNTGNPHTA